jgi:hypothetical protein
VRTAPAALLIRRKRQTMAQRPFALNGRPFPRLALPIAAATLACGGSEADGVPGGPSGGSNPELYALATEIETPEGDVLYLGTVPDLAAPFDLVAEGIELPNTSTFQAVGEQVFVAPNDAPTITRYVLDENDRLRQDATLSFAGLGVTSARDYSLISDTKAYLFDFAAYKAHVWNPSTMTLSGIEIDLGAARHDERGPIAIAPWRFDHIQRDSQLFIAGGWWPDDGGPAPYSLVLAFDTSTDTVTVLEDDRCVNIGSTKQAANGDVFFFFQAFGLVANESASPCALVIRNGQTEFDRDYRPDLPALLGGRIPSTFNLGGGDAVYAEVPYAERIEADTLQDLLFFGGNGYRFWKVDMQTEQATEVTSIDFNAGARWAFPLGDGRGLMPVFSLVDPDDESAGYISEMYEVFAQGEPVPFPFGDPSDQVQARLSDIVRLR